MPLRTRLEAARIVSLRQVEHAAKGLLRARCDGIPARLSWAWLLLGRLRSLRLIEDTLNPPDRPEEDRGEGIEYT